jgi:large subunit ribosomal protein L25
MEALELQARIRKETGKGPARRLRQKGCVPAVLYGSGNESTLLSIEAAELLALIKRGKGETGFIKLNIHDDESKTIEKLSMVKELQTNSVMKTFVHADFYEIRMDHKIAMDVPVHLTGKPVGVDNGGELQYLKREIKITGLPSLIPKHIEIDIHNLDIGDTIRVSDIAVAEGIEILDPKDVAIVHVAAPKVVVEKPEEEEEGLKEPEVIGQKKAEEEK